jgi:hypothetical protein
VELVPLECARWTWEDPAPTPTEHLGRRCLRLENTVGFVDDVELLDGVVEVELAVDRERGFHGPIWRAAGERDFESFYIRPHQNGNPDAVQYSPMFNGIGGFQLYHGEGYWAELEFPVDEWFRIRVVFNGARAEIYVAGELALEIGGLKRAPAFGRIGLLSSLGHVHVAGFGYTSKPPAFRRPAPPPPATVAGAIDTWCISDPFPEDELAGALQSNGRAWTELRAEPSGLVDLARLAGPADGMNTVLARTTIQADAERTAELAFGFSDRVAVYLNGRLLYRGADEYQSRDYRFLGSIGYWDRLYLPLVPGENELVLAVSENFGGWGLQARLAE